jgi:hypothetical protein
MRTSERVACEGVTRSSSWQRKPSLPQEQRHGRQVAGMAICNPANSPNPQIRIMDRTKADPCGFAEACAGQGQH